MERRTPLCPVATVGITRDGKPSVEWCECLGSRCAWWRRTTSHLAEVQHGQCGRIPERATDWPDPAQQEQK
jgi:hypothetical protein